MQVYMLIKVDFGHRENVGLFNTQAKALIAQNALELELFDNGNLCGVSFYIEEHYIK